ncbi:MAG: sulfatase-like hydrolase/transferase, partial [Planctomycetes bacterium]|nr:sulfatase-like hydrolase/transferase [Planctomycetota bacterium]
MRSNALIPNSEVNKDVKRQHFKIKTIGERPSLPVNGIGKAFVFSLLAAVVGSGAILGAERPLRPNIVLIVADDLGWTGLGCYGSDFYETPNIDRLAAQGMRFVNGFANASNCAPSRASLMSGQYVGRHRVLYVTHYQDKWKRRFGNLKRFRLLQPRGDKSLPNETLTLAESLKQAGYRTAMFGKWHLGVRDQHQGRRGFDVAIESHGKHFGFDTTPPVDHDPDQYLSDFLAERAVQFIREARAARRPFFLYFPDFLIHKLFEAKAQYLAYFRQKKAGQYQRSPMAAAM